MFGARIPRRSALPEPPRTLGTYEATRRLGAGGMGEVYLARDPRLEREVALKILPEPLEIVAHYELARLAEQRGALDAAREHYGRFLAYWGDADLPLASIADARARLADLARR